MKTIIQKSRYGLIKSVSEYQSLIEKLIIDPTELEIQVSLLYRMYAQGTLRESMQDQFFPGLDARMDPFISDANNVFLDVYLAGMGKVMDKNGNRLRLPKPKYEDAVRYIVHDQVKLARNLAGDARSVIMASLVKGFQDGQTYDEIASTILSNVKDMTSTRAMTIARSEVVKASGSAMQSVMTHNNVAKYVWVCGLRTPTKVTTGSCDVCRGLHENVFLVGEGPMPVINTHPNCGCVIVKAPDDAEVSVWVEQLWNTATMIL